VALIQGRNGIKKRVCGQAERVERGRRSCLLFVSFLYFATFHSHGGTYSSRRALDQVLYSYLQDKVWPLRRWGGSTLHPLPFIDKDAHCPLSSP
jgi:hypothetical protein